ncbi:putative membrane protein [Nakamurella sp. UYEF19]|uniref:vitamin K epoxide reductase family protein n=1 Tax=Nakamurella sp. UYEF19 TaxID=1756392 RepID=UPI0033995365
MTDTRPVTRSAPALASFALCLVGLLISAYLTYEHFTDSATLACSDNGAINCLKVTTSQWSEIAGVPVAVAGLAFFLAMTLLCAPTRFTREVGVLRLVGVVVGTVMVLWLVYVEIFKVDAICLWCTGVHVVTLLLLGTVLWWRESDRTPVESDRNPA